MAEFLILFRCTIHLLSNHKYLTARTVDYDENNVASCRCTFSVLADHILSRVAEDYGEIRADKVDEAVSRFLDVPSESLLKKYLTRDLYSGLRNVVTQSFQSTLWDVIRSGLANPGSELGVYAPDVEAYDQFGELLMPVIRDYHRLEGFLQHPASYWGGELGGTIGHFPSPPVLSTRIRLARSVSGLSLLLLLRFCRSNPVLREISM
jgi:hypothetical protein